MQLIYIDELGNTGDRKDPDQPIHLIGGIIAHESKIREIERRVDEISARHFRDRVHEEGFEWHGVDLFKGQGFFKGVDPAVRIAAIGDLLTALEAQEVRIGWVAVDKMRMYADRHPHRVAFILFLERLELHLQKTAELGLVVADENKEIEQRLIDDLDLYKRSTTGFGWRPMRINQVVDSLHFVQSKNNRLIQCADVVAYFALRGLRIKSQHWLAFQAAGRPVFEWTTYLSSVATRSEAAVLAISERIRSRCVFEKVFPS